MRQIVEDIRAFVHSLWTLDYVHGLEHWDRVYKNGQKLLTPDVHSIVVELFAYLHDSCREDDFEDIHHGERAAHYENSNPAVYCGTYAKYNNGSLYGMWIDLSTFENYHDFMEFCNRLHANEAEPEPCAR